MCHSNVNIRWTWNGALQSQHICAWCESCHCHEPSVVTGRGLKPDAIKKVLYHIGLVSACVSEQRHFTAPVLATWGGHIRKSHLMTSAICRDTQCRWEHAVALEPYRKLVRASLYLGRDCFIAHRMQVTQGCSTRFICLQASPVRLHDQWVVQLDINLATNQSFTCSPRQ